MLLRSVLLTVLTLQLGACGPTPTASPTPTTSGQVMIQGLSYQPSTVHVKVGGSITWTNADSVPHSVTDDASLEEFASNLLNPGDTFVQTFTHPGTFTYHCVIHSTMHGTVVVTS